MTTPVISGTLFKSIFDNKTDKSFSQANWNAFLRVLYDLSEVHRKSKRDAMLMSPAIYEKGTTRANRNVIEWAGWCAVDVDDYEVEGDLYDTLFDKFGHYTFCCYSTASSTKDSPKFRLVFPLTAPVAVDKIKRFWYALNTELGDLADKQTKDLSRMYYIPAKYVGADNFIFHNDQGSFIDPAELMFKHPYAEKSNLNNFFDRLPDEMQKQIIEHRKAQLDKTDVVWSSYRDCPFFPKQLENEYKLINNTGWYHKMYQIMIALAGNAIRNKYPITSAEVAQLCRELDMDTGNWYENRPLDKEADRALEFVYKNI